MLDTYPARSWLDPRVALCPSPINRLGFFTIAPIRAGEVAIRWGGRPITDDEIPALEAAYRATGEEYSCAAIAEGLNLLQAAHASAWPPVHSLLVALASPYDGAAARRVARCV
jgi:hypothetical protein